MILIASFPRSGNHLVRFFVEYITGRATLGCARTPSDVPIAQVFTGPELQHVDLSRPIARKEHFVRDIRQGDVDEDYDRLIYIERSLYAALRSHTRDKTGLAKITQVVRGIIRYLLLARLYSRWNRPKLKIRYESLVSDTGSTDIARLVDFLGSDADPVLARSAVQSFFQLRQVYANSDRPNNRPFISDIPSSGIAQS